LQKRREVVPDIMRIEFAIQGGIAYFPGLHKKTMIDTTHIPKEEAEELEHTLASVHFFELPERINTHPPGAADYHQYVITVEDEGKKHTVSVAGPIQNAALRSLIHILKEHSA
jgi:hypothetical protein